MAASRWIGDLEIGDCWARWRGTIGDSEFHRHFAAQAVIGDDAVEAQTQDGAKFAADCLLIDPLVRHRLLPGATATLLYIEPGRSSVPQDVIQPLFAARNSARIIGSPDGFWSKSDRADNASNENDLLIDEALARIENHLGEGAVALRFVATTSGLSFDHFRHRFVDAVGLPFRRYVLWRRLRRAAELLSAGADATTAAHEAGFADSAHFARTIKATFGITASQAFRSLQPD